MDKDIDWVQIPAAEYPALKHLVKTRKQFRGQSIYTDGQRYYHKDALHGEIEVYDKQGKHIGVLLPTGEPHPIKGSVKGRNIKKYI